MTTNHSWVLGIDAGATKTVCLLADEDGEVVDSARTTGANLQTTGPGRIERLLGQVMRDAVANHPVQVSAICIGMAGADRNSDFTTVQQMVARLGYAVPTLVVNDALIALVAGVGDAPGVVIVAGTGAIAYGRNADGLAARTSGWGYLLGDEGSGYWIGRRALRAVVRESDGRGQASTITQRLLQQFGVARAEDLIRSRQVRELEPADIAALAAHVQLAAEGGDAIALSILADAAVELADAATAVIRRLDLTGATFSVVLAGSFFKAARGVGEGLAKRLADVAPGASTMVLEAEPAIGAIRLAGARTRGPVVVPVYGRQ